MKTVDVTIKGIPAPPDGYEVLSVHGPILNSDKVLAANGTWVHPPCVGFGRYWGFFVARKKARTAAEVIEGMKTGTIFRWAGIACQYTHCNRILKAGCGEDSTPKDFNGTESDIEILWEPESGEEAG